MNVGARTGRGCLNSSVSFLRAVSTTMVFGFMHFGCRVFGKTWSKVPRGKGP